MKEDMGPVERISFTISIFLLILMVFILIFIGFSCCCHQEAFDGEPGGNPYRQYITPKSVTVKEYAASMDGVDDIYRLAQGWEFHEEEVERWKLPHQFLKDSTGDCDEYANTAVSLARAMGIPPENIRVALGEIRSGKGTPGHAWVEEYSDGEWIVHDFTRPGMELRILQTWVYYNDVYYLYESGNGNAPEWW